MVRSAGVLMQSIARGPGLLPETFDSAFERAISTLRLLHYPVRTASSLAVVDPQEVWIESEGLRRYMLALAGAMPFEPFNFGDHLCDVASRFVEQKGIAHLRTPRGRPGATG